MPIHQWRTALILWLSAIASTTVILSATAQKHWTLLALGLAVAGTVAAVCHWRGLWQADWWLGLTILGATASLQLVSAGPGVGYQHLTPPWMAQGRLQVSAVFILTVQTILVVRFWAPRAGALWTSLASRFGPWRITLLAAGLSLTSATVSRDAGFYFQELIAAAGLQAIALGSITATVLAIPQATRSTLAEACWKWLGDGRADLPAGPRIDRWTVVAALVVTVTCAVLSVLVYQRHPHVPDEVAYLFQARYFAKGMLTMPLPPVPEAFSLDLMTFEATRWYSPTPPGWPAVLAVGALLKAPWLVNPLLAGLSVVLTSVLMWHLYDRPTARLTVAFMAVSPWFLFLGMSYMTHMLSLVCGLVAALAVWHLRGGKTLWWGVAGGLGLAMLGINRPLEGLIASGVIGLWALGGPERRWNSRLAGLVVLGATAMVGAGLTAPYNRALTGDPAVFPIMAYTAALPGDGNNALGFGPDRGLGFFGGLDPYPGHSPLEAIINTNLNLFSVNIELLGWVTGSLLFIGILLLLCRPKKQDWWLVSFALAVVVVHGCYWFSGGPDFGARYWFLIIVPALGLTARGVIGLGERLAGPGTPRAPGPIVAACLLSAIAATLFVPWRATDKYFHYRGMQPGVRTLAADRQFGKSVILIRGKRHPDYASAAIYNPVTLTGQKPLYFWDRDPQTRAAVLRAFGDRPVWIVDGPTRSGAGYRVVAGPLAPDDSAGRAVAP